MQEYQKVLEQFPQYAGFTLVGLIVGIIAGYVLNKEGERFGAMWGGASLGVIGGLLVGMNFAGEI